MNILDHLSLEPSSADLVINVGKVTLGEKNREKLAASQREQERNKIAIAACSLLNSGGGVICMEMADKHYFSKNMEIGQDLEKCLGNFVDPFPFQNYFSTLSQGEYYFIFVKSWGNRDSLEHSSIIPRICSQNVNLYERSGTRTLNMSPSMVSNFLKNKKRERAVKRAENSPPKKVLKVVNLDLEENDPVALVFQKDSLEREEVLPFSESMLVEFKQFSTKNIIKYIKETISKYIPAFANTEGGYLFIGVEDSTWKVKGGCKKIVKPDVLRKVIEKKIDDLPVEHFCSHRYPIKYKIKFLEVYDQGELYGYVSVVRVEPFCCVVFSEEPVSWFVKDRHINRLSTKEWMDMMLGADSDLSLLSENFDSQLSLNNCPPLNRPVYCKKNLKHKEALQERLFPVSPGEIKYNPDSLCQELFSEHEGLEELMKEQMCKEECSQGVLIFSRSWAVDVGLQKNQKVLCDALLIAANSFPVLYTVLREPFPYGEDYSSCTAFTLKQKLVNTGGYTERLCIIPRVLVLNSGRDSEIPRSPGQPILYPSLYKVTKQEITNLLQSLVIVLLSFRSFLSDLVGHEVLNLLTIEQYNVVSKNLHKSPKLFVHGFPGTGKTVIAMKMIEKIKNEFSCEKEEILYICENQPLMNFMRKKDICNAVTRKRFMLSTFKEVKHIIIDEAQNFREENGSWYDKAQEITQKNGVSQGILWIFLDYYQTSHADNSGLPSFQYPQEWLTKFVRNADPIADFIKQNMETIKTHLPINIPSGSLRMLDKACWSSGVPGVCEIRKNLTRQQIVARVAEECKKLFQMGYSSKNIAILVSTLKDIEDYEKLLNQATKKIRGLKICFNSEESNCIVLDSIRRFSGLERNIVFGLNPQTEVLDVSYNLLVCLASRALTHLYILYEGNGMVKF
ncbi:schlafen family member 11 [Sarcophilus harrisii]|uniref:Schlafen family member 11 n=1 Tax=Sarcophilus harrisii TaxID=9305 RepID=A0A7N4NM05_SARHA|nr:schlafen family member 11 [Sarcophilus harrisii]XP_031823446.1 schlafen family member 11 [Sarcophilus harrisii]XP_031823447.1 schlafen family member 11 [Sarcophilus harrisii]